MIFIYFKPLPFRTQEPMFSCILSCCNEHASFIHVFASDDTVAIEEGIKTRGWLINSKDETDYGENNTVLHYAAHKGSVETVKFLSLPEMGFLVLATVRRKD